MARTLRQVYSSLLVNGPFTVIVARQGQMIGLTDRIRLRPLTAAVKGSRLYLSSEEAPIRLISPQLDAVWTPMGGEPVVGRLGAPPPSGDAPIRQEESADVKTLALAPAL
jgi:glutamate synthase domain-containing protein 1